MNPQVDRPNGCSLREAFELFCSEFEQRQLYSNETLTPLGWALYQVRRRIQETGWLCDHPELARTLDGSLYVSPACGVSGFEWQIHILVWTPFVRRFRDGRWVARGRPGFAADQRAVPLAMFSAPIKLDFVRSEIEDTRDPAARFVDIRVYTAACSQAGAASESLQPAQGESPKPLTKKHQKIIDVLQDGGIPLDLKSISETVLHTVHTVPDLEKVERRTIKLALNRYRALSGLPPLFASSDDDADDSAEMRSDADIAKMD
jgi:hypothetical protein